ncbi:MAG: molybdenum ABC transporter ATP-binding protein [Casimicrobiaceae bacterium]
MVDTTPSQRSRGPAVIDIDVEQPRGDFMLQVTFCADAPVLGVFGRSGAGKSSLVDAIAGVTTPRRGHVRINGVTLFDHAQRIDLAPPARRGGYVFQDALLFPHLSVHSNLMYGHRLHRDGVQFIAPPRVIDVLGLGALQKRRPDTLSGGEKQRVAIGRALLSQPQVLLLDEPLASLDVERKSEILDYIERLRDEFHIPIVYVSHSIAEITRLADSVVVLAAGKCVAAGDVGTILADPGAQSGAGAGDGGLEAGSIIETAVQAHDRTDHLTTLAFDGGTLTVPAIEAPIGTRVRVRIRARDVSLATERPVATSILNMLAATVVSIREQQGSAANVQLRVGEALLAAQITRRSLKQLAIREQQQVFALVKAVSFDRRSTGYA